MKMGIMLVKITKSFLNNKKLKKMHTFW